jgi:subtilase family serine protease
VNGFRNGNNKVDPFGGTSFGTPVFAGLLALLEQYSGTSRWGNINPDLYLLASNSSYYAAAFHDITTGNNIVPCTPGSTNCPGSGSYGYSAGVGYDQVTGLGSLNVYALTQINNTSLVTSSTNPAAGASTTFTATVASALSSHFPIPTGNVQFSVDGTASGNPVPLNSSGNAAFVTSFADTSSHTVSAAYAGNGQYSASNASLTINHSSGSGGGGAMPLISLLGLILAAALRRRLRYKKARQASQSRSPLFRGKNLYMKTLQSPFMQDFH